MMGSDYLRDMHEQYFQHFKLRLRTHKAPTDCSSSLWFLFHGERATPVEPTSPMFHSMSYLQRFELAKTSISVKLIIHSNKTQHDPPLTSTATDVNVIFVLRQLLKRHFVPNSRDTIVFELFVVRSVIFASHIHDT